MARTSKRARPDEIARAATRGDVAELERLSDRLWYELPAAYGNELLAFAGKLPKGMLEKHPRILLAAHHALYLSDDDRSTAWRGLLVFYVNYGARFAANFETHSHPSDMLEAGVIGLIGARLRGDYGLAEDIAKRLSGYLAEVPNDGSEQWSELGGRRPGWLELQRAYTNALKGDMRTAAVLARCAYEARGEPPYRHFAGLGAAALAALLSALEGRREHAKSWLAEVARCGDPLTTLEPLLMVPAQLASAHLAMDALDESGAREALRSLDGDSGTFEPWPYAAAAQARFGLLFGSPAAALARLDASVREHGASTRLHHLAGGILGSARAELLLDMGEGEAAMQLFRQFPGRDSARVLAARIHLRAEEYSDAVRVAAPLLYRVDTSHRDMLDAFLVVAAAQYCLGEIDDAGTLFSHAYEYYELTQNAYAFLQVERRIMSRLCELTGVVFPVRGDNTYAPVERVHLTPRETTVFAALVTEDSLSTIAHRMAVSLNTIRSQTRSIYRKLGVHTRRDAVAQGIRRGIYQPEDDASRSS
ncbi:helix-turn-helix transcriptional regulator [Microbacterium amylolyticum]|uniref:LuxR family maltose regulon positive regulatory protein n=1 Tax=Microbacterium amylolyticum TaxID=936337 RepID=A0ABS4ZJD4_9MICO|nr:LuxR family transcriptional regulator [Microbacterium amylolyticum]MBP2437396.1 LuxR family maltose regulon positive regulatory protein [Microbacterium amylolyticum]